MTDTDPRRGLTEAEKAKLRERARQFDPAKPTVTKKQVQEYAERQAAAREAKEAGLRRPFVIPEDVSEWISCSVLPAPPIKDMPQMYTATVEIRGDDDTRQIISLPFGGIWAATEFCRELVMKLHEPGNRRHIEYSRPPAGVEAPFRPMSFNRSVKPPEEAT